MKIIDGKNAVMGRLASYAAKELLKGEEIAILNCEQVIITGNRENIKKRYFEKRGRVGSGQKGPKPSMAPERIMKLSIRGMLPNYRQGRGKMVFSKVKCYKGIPKEFQDSKKIVSGKQKKNKFIKINEITNKK